MSGATGEHYIALSRAALRAHQPRIVEPGAFIPAAVLLLLTHVAGEDRVVLTVRSNTVEHHKGQISFPGGAVHAADKDLETTALRETWEEIGVRPEDIEVIGRLNDRSTISNFMVTPFVGVMTRPPYEYLPSPHEVAEIVEPPIAHLLARANFEWDERETQGRVQRTPVYRFEGHRIWGATARILYEFFDIVTGTGVLRGE